MIESLINYRLERASRETNPQRKKYWILKASILSEDIDESTRAYDELAELEINTRLPVCRRASDTIRRKRYGK